MIDLAVGGLERGADLEAGELARARASRASTAAATSAGIVEMPVGGRFERDRLPAGLGPAISHRLRRSPHAALLLGGGPPFRRSRDPPIRVVRAWQ